MKENEKDTVETTKIESFKADAMKVELPKDEPAKVEAPKAMQFSCMEKEVAALTPYGKHIAMDNVYVVLHIGHANSPTAQTVQLPYVAREIKAHFTPEQD